MTGRHVGGEGGAHVDPDGGHEDGDGHGQGPDALVGSIETIYQ